VAAHQGGVARVVEGADRQRGVIERASGHRARPRRGTQCPPGVTRRTGCRCLGRSPGPAQASSAQTDQHRGRRSRRRAARREHHGLRWLSAASISPFAAPRLVTARRPSVRHEAGRGNECMGVATACQLGAAPFDARSGCRCHVHRPRRPQGDGTSPRHCDHALGVVGVAGSRLEPSEHPALRHITYRNASGDVDARAGSISSSPRLSLGIFDAAAEDRA